MGDKMWWIHLGSTHRSLSLAQIRGLLLETSLPNWQLSFLKKETQGFLKRIQKLKEAKHPTPAIPV